MVKIMRNRLISKVIKYGADILISENMLLEKAFIQHGATNVFEHSFNVACISLFIVYILHLKVRERDLVRGALLHDYFLYDWHKDDHEGPHGFTHARCALKNARRDFDVNNVEGDIIEKHMFPLNIAPPKCRESAIVCAADKASAVIEFFRIKKLQFKYDENAPKT